ncbi:uncharacterized protein YgbK (DUF1537 family) [Hoeflea marina]|uniref:Uncharacterized protein YgbK (DUF1537 family) n=1 Tax=Hoeflea marina TaxID=274592 RepID=A0A317PIX8_9HYPH|nr:four-carbon acid sugar kinase family protein [Hoeflea marina]PWW00284.1 uncharacterized protein YgbK (DUF1537 family) [Hoeflea marina]
MRPAGKRSFCVFVGDDFTGASDTLAAWATAGARVRLFLDPAAAARSGAGLDIVGIATGLRGLSARRIGAEMEDIAASLSGLDPAFVHYKVCSTFDSSPDTGSIGTAVRALEAAFDPALTLVVGGQPSLGRYCLFGHLFARAADGEVHRIDRHPVMRRHPVTPMAESDLSLHLGAQGLDGIRKLDMTLLARGPEALAAPLRAGIEGAGGRFLLDAATPADLACIGAALGALAASRPILVIGASGVVEALSAIAPAPGATAPAASPAPSGACLVVAGSQSSVTEAQVANARSFAREPLPPEIMHDAEALARLVGNVCTRLRQGQAVLVHTLPGARYRLDAAGLTAALVDLVASVAAQVGIARLGVAGGDTSSAICQRLGFSSIGFGSDIDPGVSLCSGTHADPRLDGMELMLKGGQMGGVDLFDRFAAL